MSFHRIKKQNTKGIILEVSSMRNEKQNGVPVTVERSVDYIIRPDIVQDGEMEALHFGSDVADVLYEYERAQINALAKETKHDVVTYQEGWSDAHVVGKERMNCWIWKAMDTLTETQRRRFLMHVVDEYTMTRIADMENASVSAVAKSINAARKKILYFYKNRV